MMRPTQSAAFLLSRVYAEGWNAARRTQSAEQRHNPYAHEPERGRWDAGFSGAEYESETPVQ
jgi:hypothetical protein